MVQDITLSICIPTYNRAEYLEKSLESIVKQVGNDTQVEIVISDNCSEDKTQVIANGFCSKFSNIKYVRNTTNIGGDKNILQVLKLANGSYLKLINDNATFNDGSLAIIINLIRNHVATKEILFFPNGVPYLKNKDFHYTNGLDEFISIASFWSTWIGAFGIWKEDFLNLAETYNFKTSNFFHTELLFECVERRKKAVTYAKPLMVVRRIRNKKTGYNYFDVFVNGYFNKIIGGLKKENKITEATYQSEKNRFFIGFVWLWFKKIKIVKDHSTEFNTAGMAGIIFKTYKFNFILYQHLLYLPFYLFGFYCKKFFNKAAGKFRSTIPFI